MIRCLSASTAEGGYGLTMTTLGGAVAFCPLPITPAVRLLPAPTVAVLLFAEHKRGVGVPRDGGGNIVMPPVVAMLLVPTTMALLPLPSVSPGKKTGASAVLPSPRANAVLPPVLMLPGAAEARCRSQGDGRVVAAFSG